MRITSVSGAGLLSFHKFRLDLSERVTFIVGPNGAGKSNLTRLLTVCQRAIERADGATGDVDRLLASFLAARHVGSVTEGIEARVAISLTSGVERELLTEFVRAMISSAVKGGTHHVNNQAQLDAWADAEITEEKLQPLMAGEIVTSHPGTPDGQWHCAYEFTVPSDEEQARTYRWTLLGSEPDAIYGPDGTSTPMINIHQKVADRQTANIDAPIPSGFDLGMLLPSPNQTIYNCRFELTGMVTASQRRFAAMTGLPINSSRQMVGLATVLRIMFKLALVQTSDTRLVPGGAASWSSADATLRTGAEGRLPELLLRYKNGNPQERARYRAIKTLFAEFTQGRECEVGLIYVQQQSQGGQRSEPIQAPVIFVTINATRGSSNSLHEVPIEFAGAGAWEALVLASALSEPSASIAVLDEPAVALHPNLQRQLGAHVLNASTQFLVISHSAELLPLAEAANVSIVRFDRDDENATRPWLLGEACRVKLAKKLLAKGNERLPFAWRAILCEGEDDVEAIMKLAERLNIDLRQQNIAVTDCGSRDNLPDHVWFCAELGLKYLAVMDADAATPAAQPKAQAVRASVSKHGGGELFEFPQDLETTFGVTKRKRGELSRVPGAIMNLAFADDMPDSQQADAKIVELAEAIRRLTSN